MPKYLHFVPGANLVWCQVCAKKVRSFELKRRYDNVLCCEWCWNPRHPQEYPAKIRPELPPVLIAPEPEGIEGEFCELYNRQMIGGAWRGGCALPGTYFGYGVGPVLVHNPAEFDPDEFVPEVTE